MSHKIYTTQSEADYFTLNKRSSTNCSCGQTQCIRLNDEEETIIVICDECAKQYDDLFYAASDILRRFGKKLDWTTDYDATLYSLDGYEYVCLFDNSVITREEDNMWGKDEAIFPY